MREREKKDNVRLERKILKSIEKIPKGIAHKFYKWVNIVEMKGIREARKIKGYHDEPLKGKRKGQRSIRLNRSWRAIYREEKDRTINLIIVEEVNKHEY